jgi:acyl phosphate:glycerol-3-phosphate acyltransferase
MFWLALSLSYLLGSLPGSLIIGRLRGVDIRAQGSGNAGATNALRTQGKVFALATILIDVGKGMVASLLFARLAADNENAAFACAFAAVLGHCFPIFFGFRGGKGAGTGLGALAPLIPATALAALSSWLICLIATGYVGLSTTIAALVGVIGVLYLSAVPSPAIFFAIATFLLIAAMHHGNMRRLINGSEFRFEKAQIWRRWLGKNKLR